MSAAPKRPRRIEPTPIDSGALENLRYIRSTIEAADTFTTVPGKGCIAMGLTALAAVGVESIPQLTPYWLGVWVGAACVACGAARWFMGQKARAQGVCLRRAVARRVVMTVAPAVIASHEGRTANDVRQSLFRLRAALHACITRRLGAAPA